MRARRAALGLPPMQYGMAAYVIVRETRGGGAARELASITDVSRGLARLRAITATGSPTPSSSSRSAWHDYSVSNRGLRAGLVGTPEQVAERIRGLAAVGVDLCCCSAARSWRRWSASRRR
jgi:FMNH2-dependent dimethyl sulfone monooxygenase